MDSAVSVEPYSGRFTRVAAGQMMLPAQCGVCGTSDNPDGFVDLKLDFDWYGVLYLCHTCAHEMLRVFPGNPYETLQIRIKILEEALVSREEQVTALEGIISGLSHKWLASRSPNGPSNSELYLDESSDEPAVETTAGSVSDAGNNDSESLESAKSEGSTKSANPKSYNGTIADL